MGTLDLFMSRHHEELARWSREAQAAVRDGREPAHLDTGHFSGSTRVYAEALAAWEETARSLHSADQVEVAKLNRELELCRQELTRLSAMQALKIGRAHV